MKMTLNEEIEYLQSGNWYDKVQTVLPTDEYLKLGWAIGDILGTLELFRSLAPEPQTNSDRIRAMSDEELAEELVIEIEGLFPSLVYVPMATGNIYISRDKAEKEMLEYLRQPGSSTRTNGAACTRRNECE